MTWNRLRSGWANDLPAQRGELVEEGFFDVQILNHGRRSDSGRRSRRRGAWTSRAADIG